MTVHAHMLARIDRNDALPNMTSGYYKIRSTETAQARVLGQICDFAYSHGLVHFYGSYPFYQHLYNANYVATNYTGCVL